MPIGIACTPTDKILGWKTSVRRYLHASVTTKCGVRIRPRTTKTKISRPAVSLARDASGTVVPNEHMLYKIHGGVHIRMHECASQCDTSEFLEHYFPLI